MTGTMELSDQDIQDLVFALDNLGMYHYRQRMDRLDDLKERLLKVEVNQNGTMPDNRTIECEICHDIYAPVIYRRHFEYKHPGKKPEQI